MCDSAHSDSFIDVHIETVMLLQIAFAEKGGSISAFSVSNPVEVWPRSQALTQLPMLAVRLSGRGPGTFSHVNNVTGRKTIERL